MAIKHIALWFLVLGVILECSALLEEKDLELPVKYTHAQMPKIPEKLLTKRIPWRYPNRGAPWFLDWRRIFKRSQ